MALAHKSIMNAKTPWGRLYVWFCLLATIPLAHGATLQATYSFQAGPTYPYGGLVQGSDGNFYGTTVNGGTYGSSLGGYGTVFKLTTDGIITSLVSFAITNGVSPYSRLVQGRDGYLYGTTSNGGANCRLNGFQNLQYGYGTIFRVSTDGVLTSLYSFTGGNDGASPQAGLIQGSDGNFYGTTVSRGSGGYGTVFMVTTNGTLTTLASFANTDGANPYAGLVQGSEGNLYGTTANGGSGGYGTVFMVTTNGTLTTLAAFTGTNGANPYGELVRGDGNFYGTTVNGGDSGNGTVFQVTPNGTLTTLVSFDTTNGANPYSGLVQDSGGNLFGTTVTGGAYTNQYQLTINPWLNGYGTVFQVTTNIRLDGLLRHESQRGQSLRRIGSGQRRELLWDDHEWWHEWRLRNGVQAYERRDTRLNSFLCPDERGKPIRRVG